MADIKCVECGKTIEQGERYELLDTDVSRWKLRRHARCAPQPQPGMTEEDLRVARQKLYHAAIDLVEVLNHYDDGPEWGRAEHSLLDAAVPLLKERATLAVAALGNRKGGD